MRCPHCGYCPHCGRSGHYGSPFHPWWGGNYNQPGTSYWQGGQGGVVGGGDGNLDGTTAGGDLNASLSGNSFCNHLPQGETQ